MKSLIFVKTGLIGTFFLSVFLFNASIAQNEVSLLHGRHFPLSTSQYMPSELGENFDRYELLLPGLGGIYGWLGNSAFTVNEISRITNNDQDDAAITNKELNDIIDGLSKHNILGVGTRIHLLGFGMKFPDGGGEEGNNEKFSLSFDVTARAGFNLAFRRELLKLSRSLNHQYKGERIVMDDMYSHAFFNMEYAVGGAMPFDVNIGGADLTIKPGLRVKYIQNYASLYMPDTRASMYTSPDSRYIDLAADYNIKTGFVGNDTSGSSNTMQPAGWGMGLDIGTSVKYDDRIKVSLSFTDIGGIRIKNNVNNYHVYGDMRFKGVKVVGEGQFYEDRELEDEFDDEFEVDEDNNNYTMPLPSKMILQGEYHLMSNTNDDGRPYYSTAILTYVQGLNNIPGATTRPYFVLGYSHDFGTVLNAGANLGYGGYNQMTAGIFSSVRLGFFRLGIGSNNLLGYFFPRSLSAGADGSLRIALNF